MIGDSQHNFTKGKSYLSNLAAFYEGVTAVVVREEQLTLSTWTWVKLLTLSHVQRHGFEGQTTRRMRNCLDSCTQPSFVVSSNSVLVLVSKVEEQPPSLQLLSLPRHCQQGQVNSILMLIPILFLTATFYYCNILLILHPKSHFKIKSQLFTILERLWTVPPDSIYLLLPQSTLGENSVSVVKRAEQGKERYNFLIFVIPFTAFLDELDKSIKICNTPRKTRKQDVS